jgi:hypothetical protein
LQSFDDYESQDKFKTCKKPLEYTIATSKWVTSFWCLKKDQTHSVNESLSQVQWGLVAHFFI